MALLLNCGAIFLHVPKTGGSWVTDVLVRQGLVRKQFGHIHADWVRAMVYTDTARTVARTTYEWCKSQVPTWIKAGRPLQRIKHRTLTSQQCYKPFVFCFVRHPLDWYESWWRYMSQRSGHDWSQETDLHGWHPCQAIKATGDASFDQFLRNVLHTRPGFVHELYAMYAQPGIDFVGRQEQLSQDLIRVLRLLNVSFDEQAIQQAAPVNVSRRPGSTPQWDPEIRREVEKTEYPTLLRFGYASSACAAHSISPSLVN